MSEAFITFRYMNMKRLKTLSNRDTKICYVKHDFIADFVLNINNSNHKTLFIYKNTGV